MAKTHLSKLLNRVLEGEEIVIGGAGKPVARPVPFVPKRAPQVTGRPYRIDTLRRTITLAQEMDTRLANGEDINAHWRSLSATRSGADGYAIGYQ